MGFFDAREALVEALVFDAEAFVVESELVEDGGVEVADVDGIFDDVVTELVSLAVGLARLDAATSHPHREAAGMVIASVVVLGERSLTVDGAAEFAAPDDEGVVEEASLLEVADEGPGGLVDFFGLDGEAGGDFVVEVPAAVEDLGEAHAAFSHAPGEEAVVGEGAGFIDIGSVHFFDVGGFAGGVDEIGNRALHAEGHFVLGDASLGLGVADFVVNPTIHGLQLVEHAAAEFA